VENVVFKIARRLRRRKGKEKKGAACAAPEKGKRIKAKRVPISVFS
jgi:hypothetical protein